ncbi:MAG TPA: DUF4255 domain-containing protein [Thermoanaerobaculia bacterium]|nr:DUF4255 domain-containing protein [Thermoanaerobaculia bacterium]
MSNYLAIATVTATLRRMLQAVVAAEISGAAVTTVRPGTGSGLPQTGVNVFLYQVTPNPDLRNADLPTRRPDGSAVDRPVAAVDLHYLFSFYGDESLLEPHRLLGGTLRALHARPIVTRDAIRETLADPQFGFLAGSDLADDLDVVRLVPLGLNLQELSQLWLGIFSKTDYALSVAYRASAVLLTADETPSPAPPVRERRLLVETLRQPLIETVTAVGGPGEPIVLGTTVRVAGQRLRSALTQVRLAGLAVTPTAVSDTEILFPLSAPAVDTSALSAGVAGVQVLHPFLVGTPPVARAGVESNVAPLVLRPRLFQIDVADLTIKGGVAAATLTLSVGPLVGAKQRSFLLLNSLPGSATAAAYNFPLPARTDDTDTLDVPVSGVVPAVYLVRLQVDGAESPLTADANPASPTFGQYTGPTADLSGTTTQRGATR